MRVFTAGDLRFREHLDVPHPSAAHRDDLTSRGQGSYALAWKQSPRGSVPKPEDSTPSFAEMADPGTTFQGPWSEKLFFDNQEIRRSLRWDRTLSRRALFNAANKYAAAQLALHRQYAAWTGIEALQNEIARLEAKLKEAESSWIVRLLSIGWGGGFVRARSAYPRTPRAKSTARSSVPNLFIRGPSSPACRFPRRAAWSSPAIARPPCRVGSISKSRNSDRSL